MARATRSASMRRSPRVNTRIPVVLSGTLPDGSSFTEETYVLTVSKFGARLKTVRSLKPGMQVRVKPKLGSDSALFRVVWVGREGTSRVGEAGIEYVELENLFAVNFPS